MGICIPTYLLTASLIDGGMSMLQAGMIVFLGQLVILVPILLNSHAGAKFGIPSPIFWRSAFGFNGAYITGILRVLMAAGWFGITTWIGGGAFNTIFNVTIPGWKGFAFGIWISFGLFYLIQIAIIMGGMKLIKYFEAISCPLLIFWLLGLLYWAWSSAGGFGPIASRPAQFTSSKDFWKFFIPAFTANVGYWATFTLNITDFTRYAKNQKAQLIGQIIGLPTGTFALAIVGGLVTSATVVIFGEAIWDPVVLTERVGTPIFVTLMMFSIIIATLTTNIAANAVAPATDIAILSQGRLSIKQSILTLFVISFLMRPWHILSNLSAYVFSWLLGISAILGPVAGICIIQYYFISKMELEVEELYNIENSRYAYKPFNYLVKSTRNFHIGFATVLLITSFIADAVWLQKTTGAALTVRWTLWVYSAYLLAVAFSLQKNLQGGVNPIAMISMTLGIFVPVLGLLFEPLSILYDLCWFVGLITSSVLYLVLMKNVTQKT